MVLDWENNIKLWLQYCIAIVDSAITMQYISMTNNLLQVKTHPASEIKITSFIDVNRTPLACTLNG